MVGSLKKNYCGVLLQQLEKLPGLGEQLSDIISAIYSFLAENCHLMGELLKQLRISACCNIRVNSYILD